MWMSAAAARALLAAAFCTADLWWSAHGEDSDLDQVDVDYAFGGAALAIVGAPSTSTLSDDQDPILLTEGSLRSAGFAIEVPQSSNSTVRVAAGGLEGVCERTRATLVADASGEPSSSRLLGASVYRECAAALAPLRVASGSGDAVNVLNDCAMLVDMLVQRFNGPSGPDADASELCRGIAANFAVLTKTVLPTSVANSVENSPAVKVEITATAAAPTVTGSHVAVQGVDMLHLLQTLSTRNAWSDTCHQLISRLGSKEGSVMEEYALGYSETNQGVQVLTFNAPDESQVTACAAQMKVVAIEAGMLEPGTSAQAGKGSSSFVQESNVADAATMSAEKVVSLVDSPWSRDACSDIAHSFLTAQLAHPEMQVRDFCDMYARDLQGMRSGPSAEEIAAARQAQAQEELKQLRRGGKHLRLRAATVVPVHKVPPVPEHKVALAAQKDPQIKQLDTEEDGAAFWRDMLQQ